jgi:HSP20 family protein
MLEVIMNITRYEPWSILNQLHREIERAGSANEGSIATAEWAPAVDIQELDDRFVLHADIPGVKPEEIEVSMEEGVLTVKGEKKSASETEKDGYKRVERTFGSFYRRFSLPDTADASAISAKAKNGVLEISIPKKETVKPKKINVAIH